MVCVYVCVFERDGGVCGVCVACERDLGVCGVCGRGMCVGRGVYLHASAARLEVVFINRLQSQRYCLEYMRHSKPKHIAYNK